jgi:hypothetical protein
MSLPTYFKDMVGWGTKPATTARHKLSGGLAKLIDVLVNEDYYGNFIYDPEDTFPDKFMNSMAHIFATKPFIAQTYQNLGQGGENSASKYLTLAGFVKAPQDIIKSKFQSELAKAYNRQRPHTPLSPEEQGENDKKRELRRRIKTGDATDYDIQEAIKEGLISKAGATTFQKNAKLTSMQVMWKYLGKDQQKQLLPLANTFELELLGEVKTNSEAKPASKDGWGGSKTKSNTKEKSNGWGSGTSGSKSNKSGW